MPDPIYRSVVVTQLVNKVLLSGKRSTAEHIVYRALDEMGRKAGVISEDEYKLLQDAEAARNEVIAVDAFDPETFKNLH